MREIAEKMNSDMAEKVEREIYNVEGFTKLEIEQAKQSFNYNGYKTYLNENILQVKKIN